MNQKQLFMHLPQGYINVLEGHKPPQERLYDYIYQYKDHLEDGALKNSPVDCFSERARRRAGSLSFAYDRDRREVRSLTEHNYYPFGLEHSYLQTRRRPELVDEIVGEINLTFDPNTRSTRIVQVDDVRYQYKFQEQERQDELGLNWDSFKWRNYDYAIGRFMSIDPLTEEYNTWSPYAFSGNRVIDARELEGLEPYVLFGSKQEAYNNFGNQYNGLSIMVDREISTIFYSIETKDGTRFSYIQPRMGTQGFVRVIQEDFEMVNRVNGEIIACGHTHGAAQEGGKGTHYYDNEWHDDSSSFSNQDFEFSNNSPENGFNISVPEVMYAPDGGLRIYMPYSNRRKSNIPVNKNMPSDPNTGKARKNQKDPKIIPDILPLDYSPPIIPAKHQYKDMQPKLEKKI